MSDTTPVASGRIDAPSADFDAGSTHTTSSVLPSQSSGNLPHPGGHSGPLGHDLDRVETTSSIGASSLNGSDRLEKRDKEWRDAFESEDGEELIESHGCALVKEILVHGRIYVTNKNLCFKSSILGFKTLVHFPLSEITGIRPKMTALVIPNAIEVQHGGTTTTFATLPSRDTTLDIMLNLWRYQAPEAYSTFMSRDRSNSVSTTASAKGVVAAASPVDDHAIENEESVPASASGSPPASSSAPGEKGGASHVATKADTKPFSEKCLDVRLPTTPEKLFNLMYHDDDFLRALWEKENFTDVKIGEWSNGKRDFEYTKPLGGSVGPSSAKCFFTDEIIHEDADQWYGVITTTKTPEVPSGKNFEVVTKTVLTWAGGAKGGSRIVATSKVEWSGRSMLKSVINSSSITGQKDYNKALSTSIRHHIKTHSAEFVTSDTQAGADVDDELDESSDVDEETSEEPEAQSLIDFAMADPIRTGLAVVLALVLLYNLVSWLRGSGGSKAPYAPKLEKRHVPLLPKEVAGAMQRLERLEGEWAAMKKALEGLGGGSPPAKIAVGHAARPSLH